MKRRVILTFPPQVVQMPLTYRLAKDFNVAGNILRAQVAPDEVGKMVIEVSGALDRVEAALLWVQAQGITVSLISSEILIDSTCVHCGLCTGVCPTQALTLQPVTFELQFQRSRCIVCEQCVPVCPVDAIRTGL
ncbi:NIL domain-containing protein [Candidatus Cyanaurora vandensis]|uniref:NIL domain-containing protein n=1 Tax=Candidatus Cyanaurora vandensis TaxID=2714958 RepID=UPI0037C085E0